MLYFINDDNFENHIHFSALPYMLKNKYFNDAFILHEDCQHSNLSKDILLHMLKNRFEYESDADFNFQILTKQTKCEVDSRKKLDSNWANIKNIFSIQVQGT